MSWEDSIKKESKFYTKRKLKRLLNILESDMDDFSKINTAIGFVNGMIKQIDDWGITMTRCKLLDQWFDVKSKELDKEEEKQRKDLITGDKKWLGKQKLRKMKIF